jgi:pectate lyase
MCALIQSGRVRTLRWEEPASCRVIGARIGRHLYNNLWTSGGNNYCIGVGVSSNILAQNNVFIGVSDPLETSSYSNGSSVAHQEGNVFTSTSGMTADLRGGSVFTPPYTVTLDAASTVEATVRANAGPR